MWTASRRVEFVTDKDAEDRQAGRPNLVAAVKVRTHAALPTAQNQSDME
jgi:hypothetical protein